MRTALAPGSPRSEPSRPVSGHVDRPLYGIWLNLAAGVIFCSGDAIAKKLAGELAVVQITWTRYVVFVLMALLLTARIGGPSWRVNRPWRQVARGLCLVGSSLLFILGIRDVGLAEATTVGFVGPIMVTFLSIPLLGERVDARRWIALAGGMAGVVIALRPGTGTFQPEMLYRVGSALFWSLGVILTRGMATTERAETTMFWSAFTGLIVLSAVIPFHFVVPTSTQLLLSVTQGVMSSLGQWLVILSLRHAAVSTLAPYSYVSLVWTAIAGFLVFGMLPDQWTWAGAAIIVVSGLYSVWRERRRAPAPPLAVRAG
jgi:drug/metabolite transporter (DMT)-like permease